MKKQMIARVAVEDSVLQIDKLFEYLIPLDMLPTAQKGCRVLVPFGWGHQKRQGVILEISDTCDYALEKVKPLFQVLDEAPLFTEEMLELALWLRENTFCTYFDACKALLPAGARFVFRDDTVKRNSGDKTVKMIRLNPEASLQSLTPKQQTVTDFLAEAQSVSVKEAIYYTGVTTAVVTALEKKGVVESFETEVYRNPYKEVDHTGIHDEILLSESQQKAYEELAALHENTEPKAALLYGVTGSGKTSVFMKLIDKAVAQGQNVITMVPEIALTPQMLNRFHTRYGKRVAVLHSALSVGERLDEWKRIKSGEATIAIGTRSAVFAPFETIGLIIIDEEQEHTYKSENAPRFHARDVAKFRCAYHKGLLLLSSATPAVESYYYALTGKYHLSHLPDRYGKAQMPEITVVDMCREGHEIYSNQLIEELSTCFDQKKQAILLLNRRGHNTHITCRSCKTVLKCPHCSISLTYHSANRRLMCHYCGYSEIFEQKCSECGQETIRHAGLGTQRAEEELKEFFPKARILRLDADTTQSRSAFDTKIRQFEKGDFDVLLGTQMVAKGLDFPNVTLVGVLCADQALYADDFRSFEKAFSLLTQVCGRSGRSDCAGKALIQTYTPDNEILLHAGAQDYDKFYKSEITARKMLLYPPYTDLCVFGFTGENQDKVQQAAEDFSVLLQQQLTENYKELPLRILRPSPATVPKVSDRYRYKLIVKCKNIKKTRTLFREVCLLFAKNNAYKGVTAFLDMNPQNIL